jgi:hypothetical protein
VHYYSREVKLFACFVVVAGYLGVEGRNKNARKREQMEEKIEGRRQRPHDVTVYLFGGVCTLT